MDAVRVYDERGQDHQEDRAGTLVPARPAEQQPPQENDQSQEGGPHHPVARVLWDEERDDVSDHHEQHRGGDAGPQPERFARRRFVRTHFQMASGTGTPTAVRADRLLR